MPEIQHVDTAAILSRLALHHQSIIVEESGILPTVALARGYRTVPDPKDLLALGFSHNQAKDVPGLLIPQHGVDGKITHYQFRSDCPSDPKRKYITPPNTRLAVDVPPQCLQYIDDPNIILIITEGSRKADSIVSHAGYIPVCVISLAGVWAWLGTNPKGGKTVLSDWRSVALNGREVYLCFDSDAMTKPVIHQALTEFKAYLDRRDAKTSIVYLPHGENGQKTGADDYLVQGHSVADMLKLASDELKPLAEDAWPMLEPLPDLLQPVEPFAFEMLPDVLRTRVYDIANRMQCPPDYVAVGFLTALSSLAGYQIGIHPKQHDDWLVVPNLFGMCIGRPGVLKTPALEEALRDIRRLELAAKKAYEASMKERDASNLVIKVNIKNIEKDIAKALKNGQQEIANKIALEAQEEPEEVVRERFMTNDPTVEKLGEIMAKSRRCILVYRDELSGLLRATEREDRSTDRAFYLEAWSGTLSHFTYDRIGRGTIDIPNPCVSILGSIQPGPLQEYIAGTVRSSKGDDGFFQRFQVAVWPDVSSVWTNVDKWPDSGAKKAVSDLFDRLARIDAQAIGAQQEEYGQIPCLRFDTAAQAMFDEWRTDLERRLRSGDYPPAFEAHLAKYRSLVPSLALLFHLVENDTSGVVGEEALVMALTWSEYLETHAQRIYGYASNSDLAAARELHRHIVGGDLGHTFTARDVYRKHWSMLDKQGTEHAIEYLEDFGHIRKRKTGQATGRPSVEWEVNPQIVDAKKSTKPQDV